MANPYYENSDPGQRFQPGSTARADEVDAKFDEVAAGFDANNVDVERAIKLPNGKREITDTALQRRNRIVGFDSDGNLETQAAPLWRGDWATGTEYQVNHYFSDPATKNLYVTVERHTSTSLADDLAAGRIKIAIKVVDVTYTPATRAISWHANTIDQDIAVPESQNAYSFGPDLAIAPGVTVTVPDSSNWTIV